MTAPKPPLRKVQLFWAVLLLAVQLSSSAILGWFGFRLPFDNRIDRFAVKGQATETAYQLFDDAFDAPEHFVVVLIAKQPLTELIWESGETFFQQLGSRPGVQSFQSLGKTLPPGVSLAIEDLPFPFIDQGRRFYSAIFEWLDQPGRESQLKDFQTFAEHSAAAPNSTIERVVIAGEPFVNYQLNVSSQEIKTRFFPLLILFSLCFLGGLFRSIKALAVTGLAACTALSWTMGIMALLGDSLNLVTTLIPALVFVLAIAMQVHILIGIGHCGSISEGVRSKIVPNFLVALTTSLGFGSLMLSQVQPIAVMGRYMAIGIWIIFIWSHLTHLGLSRLCQLNLKVPTLPFFQRVANAKAYEAWSHKSRWLLLAVGLVGLGIWWLPRNPTESNGLMYFDKNHPIRQATDFLQTHITGASQLEILLTNPDPSSQLAWHNAFKELHGLEKQILDLAGVRHILSPASLAKFTSQIAPNIPNPSLGWIFLETHQQDLIARYQNQGFYRIQLLVNSMDREQYDQLHSELTAILAGSPLGQDALITGPLARIIEIQRYLLRSLALSLGLTIGLVLVLMMLFLRVLRQPSLILLPNLLPLGCMALLMGLLGIKTTISSVMVFSIAFGIAVDDTIHLLHTYLHRRETGFWECWRATFLQDAKAISLTTITLTAGFLILVTSDFLPTRDFGLLMALGMVCALLGDLLWLPPLLWRYHNKKQRCDP